MSKEATRANYRQALAASVDLLQRTHAGAALSTLPEVAPEGLSQYLAVRDAVTTAAERVYRYSQTKDDKQAPKTPLRSLTLWVARKQDLDAAEQARLHGAAIGEAVTLARELGNLPGNLCTPSYLADQARELAAILKDKNITCWYDPWGEQWPHDWQTWQAQIKKYLAQFKDGVIFQDGILKLTGPDRRINHITGI